MYALVLGNAEHIVYGVADGPSAIAAAEHGLPDVILTEIAVPELDGFDIIRRLSANPITKHIPSVAITGLVHADVPARARDAGFAAVFTKPVEPNTLLETVQALVLATPPDRRVRRQLRRALLTLRKLGANAKPGDAAQQRVRRLIDRLQMAVLAFDGSGRYVAVSPAVSLLTGYSRHAILSRSIFDAPVVEPVPDLERRWHDFLDAQQCTTSGVVRDAKGESLGLQAAFLTVLPGLHAAAIAPTPGSYRPTGESGSGPSE